VLIITIEKWKMDFDDNRDPFSIYFLIFNVKTALFVEKQAQKSCTKNNMIFLAQIWYMLFPGLGCFHHLHSAKMILVKVKANTNKAKFHHNIIKSTSSESFVITIPLDCSECTFRLNTTVHS